MPEAAPQVVKSLIEAILMLQVAIEYLTKK
jgi:hypothetical protein